MSYSLHFQFHLNSKDQFVKTEDIIDCFKPNVKSKNDLGFGVVYSDLDSSFIFIKIHEHLVNTFTVEGPCSNSLLYSSITKVAQLGYLICFTPDGEAISVDENILDHLPSDIKEVINTGGIKHKTITSFLDLL